MFYLCAEPPQLKGVAVAADYWHVHIDNAIETLGVQTIFANCYDRGIQAFCNQIQPHHHVGHRPRAVVRHADRRPRPHPHRARGQYLLGYDLRTELQTIHGVGNYDLGVYPHYKANLSSRWIHPSGASAGFNLRYAGSFQECAATIATTRTTSPPRTTSAATPSSI